MCLWERWWGCVMPLHKSREQFWGRKCKEELFSRNKSTTCHKQHMQLISLFTATACLMKQLKTKTTKIFWPSSLSETGISRKNTGLTTLQKGGIALPQNILQIYFISSKSQGCFNTWLQNPGVTAVTSPAKESWAGNRTKLASTVSPCDCTDLSYRGTWNFLSWKHWQRWKNASISPKTEVGKWQEKDNNLHQAKK